MDIPELYRYGREGKWFGLKWFIIYMFDGILQVCPYNEVDVDSVLMESTVRDHLLLDLVQLLDHYQPR